MSHTFRPTLSRARPALCREWLADRNLPLTPADVTLGSNRKVWWRCPRGPGHEWQAVVALRARKKLPSGCPYCAGWRTDGENSLAARLPEIAREWHPEKNQPRTPHEYTPGSGYRAWWKCRKAGHEWQTAINMRAGPQRTGCPYCLGKLKTRETSLAGLYPKIAREWHPTKNGTLSPDRVAPIVTRKYWWRCPKDARHDYDMQIAKRTQRGDGCPYCAGRRLGPTTSLASRFPALARQWHPVKNGMKTPRDVLAGSHAIVWWRCDRGPDHEWRASVHARAGRRKTGCPCCRGRQVSITNSLAAVFPQLAAQWHPRKNGRLTPDTVVAGANRRVWWKCPNGADHEWHQTLNYRAQGILRKRAGWALGCPFCRYAKLPAKKLLAKAAPEIAAEWHPTRNGDLTPYNTAADSYKSVWWRCLKNRRHEWRETVFRRAVDEVGCPECE